ncbi:MAG: hypothetical protein U0271_41555 [Polyangiaceae bacterium]
MKARTLQVAGALAVAVTAPLACVRGSEDAFFVQMTGQAVVDELDDRAVPTLSIQTAVSITTNADEQTVYLDSGSIQIQTPEGELSFDDVEVSGDFPIDVRGFFLQTLVNIEVPSPFDDFDRFDAYCNENGRSVDISLKFYSPEYDPDPGVAPPLVEVVGSTFLARAGEPEPPRIFDSQFGLASIVPGTTGSATTGKLRGDDDGAAFFVVPIEMQDFEGGFEEFSGPTTGTPYASTSWFKYYSADRDSISYQGESNGLYSDLPAIASIPDMGLVVAGPTFDVPPAVLVSTNTGGASLTFPTTSNTAPEFSALHVADILPGATHGAPGFRVVVQSAYELDLAGTPYTPPEGKYFGTVIVGVDQTYQIVSVEPLDRDLVELVDLADGGQLVATTDLPPLESAATLKIERFDSAGTSLWVYSLPTSARVRSLRPTADGGAIVALEDSAFHQVDVRRVSGADGSEIFHFVATGVSPSAAVGLDDSTFVSFNGALLDAPAASVPTELPPRQAPLLVELSPTGEIQRAAQVACSGSASLLDVSTGDVLVVGTYVGHASVGERSQAYLAGTVETGAIE